MPAFEVVFDENGGAPDIAVGVERLSFPFGFEFLEVAKNFEMSFIDGGEVFRVALEQEGKCRHIVKYQSHEEGGEQSSRWKVFQKEVVVVPQLP